MCARETPRPTRHLTVTPHTVPHGQTSRGAAKVRRAGTYTSTTNGCKPNLRVLIVFVLKCARLFVCSWHTCRAPWTSWPRLSSWPRYGISQTRITPVITVVLRNPSVCVPRVSLTPCRRLCISPWMSLVASKKDTFPKRVFLLPVYLDCPIRRFNSAKKDNDFIYHETIPSLETLTSVKGNS